MTLFHMMTYLWIAGIVKLHLYLILLMKRVHYPMELWYCNATGLNSIACLQHPRDALHHIEITQYLYKLFLERYLIPSLCVVIKIRHSSIFDQRNSCLDTYFLNTLKPIIIFPSFFPVPLNTLYSICSICDVICDLE